MKENQTQAADTFGKMAVELDKHTVGCRDWSLNKNLVILCSFRLFAYLYFETGDFCLLVSQFLEGCLIQDGGDRWELRW